jgi:SPP1 family predicted phage head-tail adaptor
MPTLTQLLSRSPIASGRRGWHRVTVQNSTQGPDGDGGYTETWTDASPATWKVEVTPAPARDLERLTGGTTISTSTHLVTGPYRADVTTKTRLLLTATRILQVDVRRDPDERHVELVLTCTELAP